MGTVIRTPSLDLTIFHRLGNYKVGAIFPGDREGVMKNSFLRVAVLEEFLTSLTEISILLLSCYR